MLGIGVAEINDSSALKEANRSTMENYREDEITTQSSADNEGGDSKGRLGEELAIKEISSSGLLELLGGEGKSPKRAGGGSLT